MRFTIIHVQSEKTGVRPQGIDSIDADLAGIQDVQMFFNFVMSQNKEHHRMVKCIFQGS